jgi:peptide deformylase
MITMKDIVREGNPVLREVAHEVPLPPTDEEKELLKEMLQFLKNSQDDEIAKKYKLRPGVGLAAPQIEVSKRMCAIYLIDKNDKLHEYMLINPKIISHSVQMSYLSYGEGCLSVDRLVPGYVPRHARIKVRAYNIDGNEMTISLRGFVAIAVQHEIDHLNGIMFYDHINQKDPYQLPEGVDIKKVEQG